MPSGQEMDWAYLKFSIRFCKSNFRNYIQWPILNWRNKHSEYIKLQWICWPRVQKTAR